MDRMTIVPTGRFKKDLKKMIKQGKNIGKLNYVIDKIANHEVLEDKYFDHFLKENWDGYRECHVESDWLLIYKIDNNMCILTLTRTGSHSDLLGL